MRYLQFIETVILRMKALARSIFQRLSQSALQTELRFCGVQIKVKEQIFVRALLTADTKTTNSSAQFTNLCSGYVQIFNLIT